MTEPTGWPHMLPCPFCGGDARHDAHADDCYFILHRKFKNSGADMSPAFEVLAAWNRRTTQPTQAQAGAVPLTDEQIKALTQARSTAMQMAAEGRIPECGDFAAIAQNLDWLCDSFGIKGGQHGAD